ncbi:MAG: hypothetical protein ACLTK0_02200 [Anaerovoracaceae bacterium]
MGLTKYAEQILNIYNYFDGAIVADRRGIIEYYYNSRKDINTLNSKEILGRSFFEIYPSMKEQYHDGSGTHREAFDKQRAEAGQL